MTKRRQIEKAVNDLYEEGLFNGCVLVAVEGEILYSGAVGLADDEAPLTVDTVFDIASVSKSFTAMAVMMLQERGELDIDETVDTYLEDFPYPDVTIRHLLHHTGGLPDYMELFEEEWDTDYIASNSDLLELLVENEPDVEFDANEQYEYSNTGYAILALVVEAVSGTEFADFLKRNIFIPLGMTRTQVVNRRVNDPEIENFAYGYVWDEDEEEYYLPDDHEDYDYVVYLDGIQGDGAVCSTVVDLLKWDRALYTNRLVSKDTINMLFTGTWTEDEEFVDYGMGWFLDWQELEDEEQPAEVVYHTGDWGGYSSAIVRYMNYDMTVIILSNCEDDLEPLYTQIDEILMEE
ncbi:MAG: class beta-lactamase-related serine hydrolase [Paenibacillus sp.]|nr:class beta-lactamase-related serine hydrolase [Paenibacillus sp.]